VDRTNSKRNGEERMKKQYALNVLNSYSKKITQALQLNAGIDYSRQDVQNQVYQYRQKLTKICLEALRESQKQLETKG
jgi:hypothetical protein